MVKKKTSNNKTYPILFWEAIQNTQMLENNDEKAIERAYKEYEKDPEYFFYNKSRKYKQV